ncbi:hypothetical protein PFISCL1PPCAC_25005, partial [Pristionchus fissidentatus]
CDPYSNWVLATKPSLIVASADNELDPQCVEIPKACDKFTSIDSVTKLPVGIESTISDGEKRFTCVSKNYSTPESPAANTLTLNTNLVFSALTCNPAEGYTDIEGKKWAEAEDEINLNCEPSPCTKRDTLNCNYQTLPKGYKCSPN